MASRSFVTEWLNRLLLVTNILLVALVGGYLATRGIERPPKGLQYADVVTIILAAVAVMLAIVTLFVGILALWGYRAMRQGAENTAREVGAKVADVATPVAIREARAAFEAWRAEGTVQADERLAAALKEGGNGDD
jgi:hypothetical protein